jgi:hypothetical protein
MSGHAIVKPVVAKALAKAGVIPSKSYEDGDAVARVRVLAKIGPKELLDHECNPSKVHVAGSDLLEGAKICQKDSWFAKENGEFKYVEPPVRAMVNAARANCWCVTCAYSLRLTVALLLLLSLSAPAFGATPNGLHDPPVSYRKSETTRGLFSYDHASHHANAQTHIGAAQAGDAEVGPRCRFLDAGWPHPLNCSDWQWHRIKFQDAKPPIYECHGKAHIYLKRKVAFDNGTDYASCPVFEEPVIIEFSQLDLAYKNAILVCALVLMFFFGHYQQRLVQQAY